MSRSSQKGIAHLGLVVFVLLSLIGVVVFFVFKGNVPKNRTTTIKTVDGQTVQLTKDYENPFDEKTQYSNPFEEEKNPFDYLNE